MNICNDRHATIYKITYKGFKGSKRTHKWLVCNMCMENKLCFNNKDEILKIVQVSKTIVFNV